MTDPAASDPCPAAPTLALRLRDATRTLHTSAERSGAMAALLAGQLPLPRYRALLVQMLALYEALEAGLARHASAPWLAGLDLAALARVPGLRADLAGHARAQPQVLLPATRAYVARLQALDRLGAPALLGHVYTRYLGDLHGGQILRRIVQRHYAGQGTAFHEFGDGARVLQLREQLRHVLARVSLPSATSKRVVDEACWSFEQHRRLFDELAPST